MDPSSIFTQDAEYTIYITPSFIYYLVLILISTSLFFHIPQLILGTQCIIVVSKDKRNVYHTTYH